MAKGLSVAFRDSALTLYHGDCLSLPSTGQRGDVLLTDPPYSRAGALSTGRRSASRKAGDSRESDQFWAHWFADVFRAVAALLPANGCGFVFCDYRTIGALEAAVARAELGWHVSQCLVWDRESLGMGSPFRASFELIAFLRGPSFKWSGRANIPNVVRYRWPYTGRDHPTEKPVGLLRKLLSWVATEGYTVIDPFAGSGSTLVAARQLSMRGVGVELLDCYRDLAVSRLMQKQFPD
jgi:site-specific DNA-methyltransferase (adenine-specific)